MSKLLYWYRHRHEYSGRCIVEHTAIKPASSTAFWSECCFSEFGSPPDPEDDGFARNVVRNIVMPFYPYFPLCRVYE